MSSGPHPVSDSELISVIVWSDDSEIQDTNDAVDVATHLEDRESHMAVYRRRTCLKCRSRHAGLSE